MRALDTFSMCIRNLWKRKLRTFLTLLGVMIGTGSIIVMISLGLATDAQFAQMIEDMNLNMTEVQVSPQWGGTMWSPETGMVELTQRDLTDESIERFMRIPGVRAATPMMHASLLFRTGPYSMVMSVTGIRPDALALMGHNMESGRLLQEGGEFEAVFSARTELGFFDASDRRIWESDRLWGGGDDTITLVDIHNDPIRIYYDTNQFWNTRDWGWGFADDDFGQELDEEFGAQYRSFNISVVGVIAPPAIDMRWGGGTEIYMDIETLQTLIQIRDESHRRAREEDEWSPHFSAIQGGARETYNDVRVRTASMHDTARVAEIIEEMGYRAWFPGEWIDNQREMQRGMETLLAAIAAVSLAVAAINIANTMITSVTERTREIGVMKVIGASISDVRKLFLLESVVIGLMGGILGVGLALGMSYAMNNFDIEFLNNLNMGAPDWAMVGERGAISLITPELCFLALAIAAGVGLVSGYYPAWRATRLSALAAIRGD